jgi:hypothetical protein
MRAREIVDDTPVYLIGYDLHGKTDIDYTNINNDIEKIFPTHLRILGSTWLVRTYKNAEEIVNALEKHFSGKDKLLVIHVGEEISSKGLAKQANDTIRSWLLSKSLALK